MTGVHEDPNLKTIVGAMISLGKNLGMQVLGEGVETDADLNTLADLGCDVIQGYRIGRAMDFDRFSAWRESRNSGPVFERTAA